MNNLGRIRMARPCKSAKVLTEKSQTKAEIQDRIDTENKLKGGTAKLKPPKYLSANQRKIFREIVGMLNEADILSDKDVYLLSECSISINRMQDIEELINKSPESLFDSSVMSAKDKYTKIFFRCCNELCLSPQSRAKIANINLQAKEENPLIKALMEDD